MNQLAAEITARTGRDPGEHYRELTAEFGTPHCTHITGDLLTSGRCAAQACSSLAAP